jgi:endonuclease G
MGTFAVLGDPPPIALQSLDFCLAAVSMRSVDGLRSLSEFGWLPLNPEPGKAFVGEYLTIVQHPKGERKQVCVRENKLLKYDPAGNSVWYMTDTVPGSSGSPVFNGSWQVVALHHSGVPKTDNKGRWLTTDGKVWDASMDESQVAWEANEGIRISRILEYLRSPGVTDSLAATLLQNSGATLPPTTLMTTAPADPESIPALPSAKMQDGELRVTIPVQIGVRVGALPQPAMPVAGSALPISATTNFPSIGLSVEKVVVDQSNYNRRPGYDPEFLGKNHLRVPLPSLGRSADVLEWTQNRRKNSEFKYWNYSVVMNKGRKLAFFSAVNVDAKQRPDGAGREGDVWYYDTRPPNYKKSQLGSEFYGKQKTFEVDRSQNPFDRGHLTRRLDAQWGENETESTRNGNDSFHWTNCSPQHWRYNQGAKKWLGLEDYVIKGFANRTGRACVINGPVFNAPLSKRGPGGRPIPTIGGKRHKDPTFGGVAIPKLFFKVVSCERASGSLATAAFLMSQEDMLAAEDRIVGLDASPDEMLTEAEARLYEVSIADLEKVTGLDFGPLQAADTFGGDEALTLVAPIPLDKFEDIRLA